MKQNALQFTQAGARLLAAAALAASLAFAPGAVLAADKVSHAVRAEQHGNKMHDKLMIMQDQEEQWSKVALVMAENAKSMDTLTYELNAVVLGRDFAGQMTAMISRDLAASEAITRDGWAGRSLLRIKEWGASLLQRLL